MTKGTRLAEATVHHLTFARLDAGGPGCGCVPCT